MKNPVYMLITRKMEEVSRRCSHRKYEQSGASFVFLFLFLHFGRAITYGSYFYNPNTWFSGIIIFFFLMATAFMGYVLPFGQMSFWGATVITNLLSPFPSLIEWVSGGHYVYNLQPPEDKDVPVIDYLKINNTMTIKDWKQVMMQKSYILMNYSLTTKSSTILTYKTRILPNV